MMSVSYLIYQGYLIYCAVLAAFYGEQTMVAQVCLTNTVYICHY